MEQTEQVKRTKEEIQKDFDQVCLTLGDLSFKVEFISAQRGPLLQKLGMLNQEMSDLLNEVPIEKP